MDPRHGFDVVLPPDVQKAYDAYYDPLRDYPMFQDVFRAGWEAAKKDSKEKDDAEV